MIHLARWQDRTIIVKKPLKKDQGLSLKELEVFRRIQHPHVLNLLGSIPSKGWLLLPHMEKGSLKRIIFDRNSEPFPWSQRWQITCDIVSGLQCLHQNGILHCDIKPENVLLDKNYHAKLCDFGTVQIADREDLRKPWGGSLEFWSSEIMPWARFLPQSELHPYLPINRNQELERDVPPFSEGSDIFALGTLMWEISERSAANQQIIYFAGKFRTSDQTPASFAGWIRRCRSRDSKDRPSALDLGFQKMWEVR